MELPGDNKVIITEADYDHLTHVFNRRIFFILLENEYLIAKNNDLPLSYFDINIDNFKRVNDTYGWDQGNMALITIASIIHDGLGQNSVLCRIGGDNFNAFLPNTSQKEAQVIADRISQSVANHLFIGDSHLTVSIGVAELQSKNESLIELLQRADENRYRIKMNKKRSG